MLHECKSSSHSSTNEIKAICQKGAISDKCFLLIPQHRRTHERNSLLDVNHGGEGEFPSAEHWAIALRDAVRLPCAE